MSGAVRTEIIGDATLILGDCREVLPTLEPVDVVFTDPPYSHKHMDGGGFAAGSKFYRDGALVGLNDFVLDKYSDLLIKAAPFLIAFHSRDLIFAYSNLAQKIGRIYDLHFWHKSNAIPFCKNTFKSDIEYISLIWNKKPGWAKLSQEQYSKVWISSINSDNLHPAAKPIPLLIKYIKILEPKTIIDPFMGSGTTGVACINLGRKFIGIEIEPKYFDISCRRISDAWKNRPTLFPTEEPQLTQPDMFPGDVDTHH